MDNQEITLGQVNPESLENPMTEEQMRKKLAQDELIGFINQKFRYAADNRQSTENNWLDAYRNWRGVYSPDQLKAIAEVESRTPNACKSFLKITKPKVLAAYGQILEILFSSEHFPIGIEPTPVPEGIPEKVHLVPESAPSIKEPTDVYGYPGDGKELPKGATSKSLFNNLSATFGKLLTGKRIIEGESPDKAAFPELYPAERAARKMEKLMQDQLTEDDAEFALRRVASEMVMYGSGIMKGPFNYDKIQHKFVKNEAGYYDYAPVKKRVPKIDAVSCWNFYPDPDARRLQDAEWAVERHLLGRNALRKLKNLAFFNKEALERVLKQNPSYTTESWEQTIKDNQTGSANLSPAAYEILEYWGYIDEELAERLELTLDPNEDYQVNVWVCRNEILKVVINPFQPQAIPYCLVPYEEHPHQLWGVGVPENMRDTQEIMNGHFRMAVDNLKLSGSLVFEVDERTLSPNQDMSIYPGKFFRKQAGAPGQTIFGISFPNTTQQHLYMFDKARQLADEETGMPSYAHGVTNVVGTTKTAAGMSMLMGAAQLSTKTVVKNIDHYLLTPLGKRLFYWNMQFNGDQVEIVGDVEVVARGTSYLMMKEVQSQRLMQFLQIGVSNPMTAPMVNVEYILKEIGKTLDLDPDKVVNDPIKARLYAEMLQMVGGLGGNQQGIGPANTGTNGGTNPNGSQGASGGGGATDNLGPSAGGIGVGSVPQSGEAGFSGGA